MPMHQSNHLEPTCLAVLLVLGAGCHPTSSEEAVTDTAVTAADAASTSGDSSGEEESDTGECPQGGCLDLMPEETEGSDCEAPEHVPCDADSADIFMSMGLNCPGEPQVDGVQNAAAEAIGIRSSYGATDTFNPTEGTQYVVLGTGFVSELDTVVYPACEEGDLGAPYDLGITLPAPIRTNDVGAQTCAENPALVGTGDCSNTIQGQFEQGLPWGAADYSELRFTAVVPEGVTSFSYDFAFLTTEYPVYYGTTWNDMYIGWLESEAWTGNMSFDGDGNPISLNAGFLDLLDADHAPFNGDPHPECPEGAGCVAPELHGTCMEGNGATKWLTSEASVAPGETITVVFAIMDMADGKVDSFVFLDNFGWGCEGGNPPTTVPIP